MLITINSWEKYNGRRNHLKNARWFKFWHSAFDSVSLWDLTPGEKWVFVCLLGSASMRDQSNGTFEIEISWFSHKFNIEENIVISSIKKLIEKQLITTSATLVQHMCDTSVAPVQHQIKIKIKNKIKIKKIHDHFSEMIEPVYFEIYPKKIGKQKGIEKLSQAMQSGITIDEIRRAMLNYAEYVKGNDMKYIKHFSTWASEWEDWLNVEKPKRKSIIEMLEAEGV